MKLMIVLKKLISYFLVCVWFYVSQIWKKLFINAFSKLHHNTSSLYREFPRILWKPLYLLFNTINEFNLIPSHSFIISSSDLLAFFTLKSIKNVKCHMEFSCLWFVKRRINMFFHVIFKHKFKHDCNRNEDLFISWDSECMSRALKHLSLAFMLSLRVHVGLYNSQKFYAFMPQAFESSWGYDMFNKLWGLIVQNKVTGKSVHPEHLHIFQNKICTTLFNEWHCF